MTSLSVIVVSLNEGESLRRTVDNLRDTLPQQSEIIVVDDGSTDRSSGFLSEGYDGVTLLRPEGRLGAIAARNLGASQAKGDVLVFSDAHVVAPPGWVDPLVDVLARPEVGAAAPAISTMRPAVEATGYGQKWQDASLTVAWLGQKSSAPYPVPLLGAGFLALRRDVFTEIGGFDSGLVLWGAEDSELSMRLWMYGYECWVVPGVDVQHAFRTKFPYEIKWEPVLHNRLRLASIHFGPRRLLRVVERLKQYDEFAAASARLLAGDLGSRVAKMRQVRQRDDDWFFRRFESELRSDLSEPDAPTLPDHESSCARISVPGGGPVSACLLSWKRPQNLPVIVRALRRLEFIDEILIWNNNPDVPLELTDSITRVIQSSENQSCYGRFLCAAQARNPVVYVQDDDVLNHDIAGLYRQFLRAPAAIAHALAPTHWGQRNRQVYGNAQAALIGWGAFFRKEWLSPLDELTAPLRADPLFRREADRYMTLWLERRHHAVAGDIEHLDGHSTAGIALWRDAGYRQLAALAISQALRLLRLKNGSTLPWNVVIPCHNYGRYLAEAVESVLANDADCEITIVDDASSDETAEVAADFAARHPHIRYLHNAVKRGPGYSRNRGVEAVESTFVAFLDADDRFGPDYLFAAAKVLMNGADVVNPDANLFGAIEDRWVVPDSTTLRMLLQRNSVHYCSAFRRELWSEVGGIDEDMPCWMDYEFWIRMAAAGAQIQGLHGDHFFYRQHDNNLSATANTIAGELRRYLHRKHAGLFESFDLAPRQTG
jgi:glycosyltransferase involved in cell wall biosynthesis